MSQARYLVAISIACAALATQHEASAEAPDPAAAEALFQRGRDAAARGDWPQACASFAESLRFDPAPGTRLNLADCEERTNLVARAWQDYEVAASQLPADDPRHAFARSRAAALEPRLARLVVRLAAGAPATARVERDGFELGAPSLGVAVPVDPGRHVLTVVVPGALRRSLEVTVAERETREVVLDARGGVEPAPKDHAPVVPPPARTAGGDRVIGFVALGIGAAGLALGSVSGLLAFDATSDVRAHCDGDLRCDPQGLDAGSRARSWSTVSTVAFAVGLAGVAVGAYFLIVAPHPSDVSAPTVSLRGKF